MKFSAVLSAFLVSACATMGSKDRIQLQMDDAGVCKHMKRDLIVESPAMTADDVKDELVDLGYLSEEWARMQELHNLHGGVFYELRTSEKTWGGLHGAWGFGLVRDSCLIYFMVIVAS